MEKKLNDNSLLGQEEYEYHLGRFREVLLDCLDEFEVVIEESFVNVNIPRLETLLDILLLVSDTQKGQELFIRVLDYVKYKRPLLANKYWDLFDDRDNLFKKRFFNITLKPPKSKIQ